MTGGLGGGDDSFLTRLLGDLMSLMGSTGTGERRELARQLAQGVAGSGQPEANVDPVERIRLEELLRVAELHVAELTGLSPGSGGGALSVDAVGPAAWARRTVDDWAFVLDAMTVTADQAGAGAAAGSGATGSATPGDESEVPEVDVLARFMGSMGPMLAAMQLGSAIGHLAQHALGQYEIPLWRAGGGLLMVPANLARFAEDWSVPADDVRLWVCLRDVTVQAVLGREHVRRRIAGLVSEVVRGMAVDAAGLAQQLQQLDLNDPDSLERVFGNPEALVARASSPQRERASEQLMAVTTALSGYVEHVLDRTAARLLGGRGALTEAWRRRQVARDSSARAAEMLFGLDLGPAQVDSGVAFVSGVLERAGEEGLARLWASAATLPTPAEIDAPGLWLERISFEEPPAADG